jgi:hypothetical protein
MPGDHDERRLYREMIVPGNFSGRVLLFAGNKHKTNKQKTKGYMFHGDWRQRVQVSFFLNKYKDSGTDSGFAEPLSTKLHSFFHPAHPALSRPFGPDGGVGGL